MMFDVGFSMMDFYSRRIIKLTCFICIFFVLVISDISIAEDWPTYQHDSCRSGITSERLAFPLNEIWNYTAKHKPQPAWPDPAKEDIWHQIKNLRTRVTFDRAFHPVVVGDVVYFGSSADDKLYALNAKSGEMIWSFFAEAPIRLAPSLYDGKVYFGSDDGYVYCLNGNDGKIIWKYKPALKERRIIGNGRMISAFPVRTGVIVKDNLAYFGVGLFPDEKVYICAVNAQNGSEIWLKEQKNISPQGYIIASETRLYFPTGRTVPVAFTCADGESLGEIKCPNPENGTYAILKNDEISTSSARIMIAAGEVSYLLMDDKITAKNLSVEKWKRQCHDVYSMILADDVLIVGGDGEVYALSVNNGDQVWNKSVSGKAYGLAVANGSLFVSTDKGVIHCFGNGEKLVAIGKLTADFNQLEAGSTIAKQIVEETGIKKGYCLLFGCGEGYLASELAKQTDLQIIGIDEDENKVALARENLDKAGLYGVRVAIHHGDYEELPYTDFFANLIVSDAPVSEKDIFRLLRPYSGVAYLKQENGSWIKTVRGPLDGGGEWTHQYADLGNTACSKDELVRSPVQVQWFGNPGPRSMVDRHHRAFAPLWKDGRLFIPAARDNKILAIDAYNGTILWETEVPDYRRVGANRDCGGMVVAKDCLYTVTEDTCWIIDVETGEHTSTLKLSSDQYHWGYIAVDENLLFGSGQKKDAARRKLMIDTVNELYYDNKPCVISDYLFCMDRHSGQEKWTYKSGSIINPAIAIGEKFVYFIESRNSKVVSQNNGKATLKDLLEKGYGYLIALDKKTGSKAWERQVDLPFENIIHLSYANKTLLAVGTKNEGNNPRYDLYAFDADNGADKWQNHYVRAKDSVDGGHGEQEQHPTIVNNSIYMLESSSYDLQTGEIGTYNLTRGGHGCGTLSGSNSCLFARGGNPRIYETTGDLENGEPLTLVSRPGCWINIIPAGGLILIPEYSSGCTCPYPIQTSIALIPKSVD